MPAASRGAAGDAAAATELEQLGDSIAELAAHLHAATYRLLVMLAEFDRREGWSGGFRSCAHWLSWRTRIDLGAAREKVRVARALERLPELSAALRRGELSYAVVRAVTRVATPENERALLELARHGTASHMERVVRAWRRVDRLGEQWAERERHRARCVHLYPDDDGMYVLRARLSPEVGALLERALAAATEALRAQQDEPQAATPDTTSHAQRQADAIGLLAEWALGSGHLPVLPEQTGAAAASADAAAQRDGESVQPTREMTAQRAVEAGTANAQTEPAPLETAALAPPRKRPLTVGRAERFQVVVHVDAEALRAGSDSGQAVLAGGLRGRVARSVSRPGPLRSEQGDFHHSALPSSSLEEFYSQIETQIRGCGSGKAWR